MRPTHRFAGIAAVLVSAVLASVVTAVSASPLVPPPNPLATVVEFYNTALGHYFVTAEPAEAANIDAGGVGPNWTRTGYTFAAYRDPGAGRVAVCRFFGRQPGGPNSHFYTADPAECARVKLRAEWSYEGIAFYIQPFSATAGCPAGTYRVYRAYNNAAGGDPNHRYTNRPAVFSTMAGMGWYPEGEVMCTPTPPATLDEVIAACPTAAEVDAFNATFAIRFLRDVSAPALVCTEAGGSRNLTRVQERLYQALKAMTLVRFASPLPWTAQPTLFDWMAGEAGVRGIDVDAGSGSYCCDAGPAIHVDIGANATVLATTRWVDLAQGFGLADLVDVIAHESRHNQGKVHTCTSVVGSDQTLSELGAWAIVYYDYAWLAGAADPSFVDRAPVTNSYYRSYHDYYLARAASTLSSRICNPNG